MLINEHTGETLTRLAVISLDRERRVLDEVLACPWQPY